MFNFINYIRVIATALITNSHFSNIWPISALAAGGMLGNILFFAVSGFCLFVIKDNFIKWIFKRFLRVYPALILVTLITILLGFYKLSNLKGAFRLFVFPTNYVFLVWLMVCYFPFYLFAYLDKKHKNVLEICLFSVVVIWLIVYIFFLDKTAYVIDKVENPFILFLYFSSMLAGALFKKHYEKFTNYKLRKMLFLIVSLIV